jgi:pimeloyl-ACP methyl ester carboxylesterase
MTERRVQGRGVELAVTERGDPEQPTIVLVHGFPDTQAVWRPVAELLASDFHVVTYDVRGAGQSGTPTRTADYRLALLVADMGTVIDAVSPEHPVHLVGHDWGSIQGWEATTDPVVGRRVATYTSISAPPLDHAALWARRHFRGSPRSWGEALRQGLHSWYIAFFHLPFVPQLARLTVNRQRWARSLLRVEGLVATDDWPAATLASDVANGVALYRANVRPRFRSPQVRRVDTPIQLIVATKDHYVTPALLEGLEEWSSQFSTMEVPTGHWIIRTHPEVVAEAVRQLIARTPGTPGGPAAG